MTQAQELRTLLLKHPESEEKVHQILTDNQPMDYAQAKSCIATLDKETKFRLCQILKV